MSAAAQHADAGDAKKRAAHHPWRENLETVAVAIVMALLLKYFTLEAFQIPTGSMQPTLMGLDTSRGMGPGGEGVRVFDRILVDKLLPFFRDPKRWEIWVFVYPLDRSERYIKRVVGMPGEQLKILNGDIYTRGSSKEEWKIQRKPTKVQREMWREVWSSEEAPAAGDFWALEGFKDSKGTLAAAGKARASTRAQVLDAYEDGYPPALRRALRESAGHPRGQTPVRDMRLRFEIEPNAQVRTVSVLLAWGSDQVRVEISGPAGDGEAHAFFNDKPVSAAPARLPLDAWSEIEVFRADEAMELSIDGRTCLRHEFESTNLGGANRVTFETEGGAAQIRSIRLDRDVHYTNQIGSQTFTSEEVPPGHYLMLGDNSIESSDGRAWMGVPITLEPPVDGMSKLFGGTLTSGVASHQNPRELIAARPTPQRTFAFRDEFGEIYRYHDGIEGQRRAVSFVPRDYFLGRAFFVFWPFPPFAPVVRLGLVR